MHVAFVARLVTACLKRASVRASGTAAGLANDQLLADSTRDATSLSGMTVADGPREVSYALSADAQDVVGARLISDDVRRFRMVHERARILPYVQGAFSAFACSHAFWHGAVITGAVHAAQAFL
jgi:hypothetical protein